LAVYIYRTVPAGRFLQPHRDALRGQRNRYMEEATQRVSLREDRETRTSLDHLTLIYLFAEDLCR